jgi:hypothetical protein
MGHLSGNPGSNYLIDYLQQRSHRTRDRKIAKNLTQGNILELGDIDKVEVRQLIARQISNKSVFADQETVDKLLELLMYLPLAIVHVVAFINSS